MKIFRTAVALVASVTLLGGSILPAAAEGENGSLSVPGGALPQATSFTAKVDCGVPADGVAFSKVVFSIDDKRIGEKKLAPADRAVDVAVTPSFEHVGKKTLKATCASYHGKSRVLSAEVEIEPQLLLPDRSTWKSGDSVRLRGLGFQAGEKVQMSLVRVADGKVYQTLDAGVASPTGAFDFTMVIRSDVPKGDYELIATGASSGVKLKMKFYWGHSDKAGMKTTDKAPKAGKRAKLPSTGV